MRLRIGVLALLVVALTAGGAGLSWWQADRARDEMRAQLLLQADQRGRQLADAMGGQMEALLSGIDLALLQLRREWDGDAARFDPLARALLAALPAGAVSHVTVVGADGHTVYNSLDNSERVWVGDREHFKAHLDGGDRLVVGAPVLSRLGKNWTFVVSHRIVRDGVFAGTMNMSVTTDYIASRLAALELSPRDVVALVHPSGVFMARSRDNAQAMGQRLPADRPFLVDPAVTHGAFRTPGLVDGVPRLYSWRRLASHGLVVAVGLDEAAALAPLEAGAGGGTTALRVLVAAAVLLGGSVAWLLWLSDRRQRALERSEQRYRALIDNASDAIFFNEGGRFTHLNPAAVRLFGARDAGELIGTPVIERIHPDSRAAVAERVRVLTKEHRAVPPLPERYLRLDGSVVDVEVTAAPFDGDGEPGMQVIVRDITERRRAEQALQQLNAELEQRVVQRTAEIAAARDEAERANRAKSEFLSRMSHELRTPLNAILGFGQLLAMDRSDPARAAHVREILTAGRHLLELINEVLDLARIEAGHFSVSVEPVALGPLVDECMGLLRPQADARGITLHGGAADVPWTVRADRTRLRQVLLNLIGNAIKYNRPQGRVSVHAVADGDVVRLRVDDTGPGLDAAQRARLFVPFERLGVADPQIEGTGIGLALSKRLIELMGGAIGVDSRPGEGSSFWVELPRAVEPAVAIAAPSAAGEAVAAAPATSPRIDVVCIEDNEANARLVEHICALRPAVRLHTATTPAEGLALAHAHRPALVLLDIHLPGMDGFAVLERLRADPVTRDVPVIAVSANAMPRDIERARAAGFDDYLTKPLQVTDVLQLLDAHGAA
jgi:PAS domain S-box-containing protein